MESDQRRLMCRPGVALRLLSGAAAVLSLVGLHGCERSPDPPVSSTSTTKPRPITVPANLGGPSTLTPEPPPPEGQPTATAEPRIKPPSSIGPVPRIQTDTSGAAPGPSTAAPELSSPIPESLATGQTSGTGQVSEPARSELSLKAPEVKPPNPVERVPASKPAPPAIQGPPDSLSPNIDG